MKTLSVPVFLTLACFLMPAAVSANENSARVTPVVKVVSECADSVVNISTEKLVLLKEDPFWGSFHTRFADMDASIPIKAMTLRSVGSGVVLSKDGLILTNAHVVQQANKIFVIFVNGQQVVAQPVSMNPGADLALIRVDVPEPLKPVKFAKDVIIGETVVAIGDPLGYQNSVSAGVVSGTHREIPNMPDRSPFKDLIQVDAHINFGNSGGGLFNLDGEFMGITLAMAQNAQGIGFVIPVTKIQEALAAYREHLAQIEAKKAKSI